MAEQGVFLSARALNEMVYKYVEHASSELGVDKALALLSNVADILAVHQAQVVRETMGAVNFGLANAFDLCRNIISVVYGMDLVIIEQAPDRVVAESGRCPVYDACQLWGIDSKIMCRAGPTRFMDVTLKRLNPDLSYQILKYRSSAENCCRSAVVLGQGYRFPE